MLRLHEYMQRKAIFGIPAASKALSLSPPTIASAIGHLTRLGLLKEITKKGRNRRFAYEPYVALLNQGTEPLAPGA
ncbi:MAG: hypothetical protein ABI321_18185 [Polyangia bacterium]